MDVEAINKLYEELQALVDELIAARGTACSHFVISARLVPPTCSIVGTILEERFPDDFRPESAGEVDRARDRAFHAIQDRTNCRFRDALENTLLEQWELVDKLKGFADRIYDLLAVEYEVKGESNVE